MMIRRSLNFSLPISDKKAIRVILSLMASKPLPGSNGAIATLMFAGGSVDLYVLG